MSLLLGHTVELQFETNTIPLVRSEKFKFMNIESTINLYPGEATYKKNAKLLVYSLSEIVAYFYASLS